MEEVALSTNEFKALSSKTRTDLLKMLEERNYTLSELATKSGMAAPTVKQHTSILVETGLIELKDEGRKWKYYSLTKKGKQILQPKEKQSNILIILSSTIVIGLIGIVLFSVIGFQELQSPMMAESAQDRATINPFEIGGNEAAEITAGPSLDSAKIIKCFSKIEDIRVLEEVCAELNDQGSCESFDLQKDGLKDCEWK